MAEVTEVLRFGSRLRVVRGCPVPVLLLTKPEMESLRINMSAGTWLEGVAAAGLSPKDYGLSVILNGIGIAEILTSSELDALLLGALLKERPAV